MSFSQASVFSPPALSAAGKTTQWGKLYGSAMGLVLERIAQQHDNLLLVVTQDTHTAQQLTTQLAFFLADNDIPLIQFPDWETLPYDVFSPHQDIISERLEALYRLPSLRHGILIVPVQTLMHRLPPREYIQQRSLILRKKQSLSMDDFRIRLVENGYQSVSSVMEHGEFTTRGSLIDLFPMGSKCPYRIELFDDEIDSIRTFDPESQRTIDIVDTIQMLPAREFPLDEQGTRKFRQSFRARFEGDPQNSIIYRDISQGMAPPGIEYYIPLFFDKTNTLFDYLPDNTHIFKSENIHDHIIHFEQDINNRYDQLRHDIERPVLPPDLVFMNENEIDRHLHNYPVTTWQNFEYESADANNFSTLVPPNLTVDAKAHTPAGKLLNFLMEYNGRVLFAAETTGRRESLLELLHHNDIHPKSFSTWHDYIDSDEKMGITVAPLEQGLFSETPPITIIAETQIYGQQVFQRRRRKTSQRDSEFVFKNLAELSVGSPVVHEDYGVGRYLGLQTLETAGIVAEFLSLEYADHDKLYVPVSSLHLISRYTGVSPENAPLHKLGSGQWERAKRKASKQVRDVAAELLDIYAKRESRVGFAYPVDHSQLQAFASEFPFEETPDQITAIENIIENMHSPKPMDHLVCGDVGFGKTEVAMRAAFIAVMAGKQVAILAPTTLLTEQHTQTFRDRFSEWPVRVESLSRFRSKKEQDKTIHELKDGKIDIVIGTHKLLQDNIKYKNLGLVIIDEEHRFGVRQKDKFKALRSEVDVLTLTATPIPRTLNMAMSGLRDLSIIATPPARRLAIKTFVSQWSDNLIIEACARELIRGGQVFFVHNEVESIEKQVDKLHKILPDAKINFAHGQMRERELEQVMSDFYHQRFNILVCTTIIETGIDIPNANTIIINRADKFGLAQLYQLRGRVGRSHHRAYAYLLTPSRNVMTADAQKRLEAIESIETLGTGFTLATHDLEIRGAGELLGDEQSGQMQEIGFSMYTELLERAVKALREGKTIDTELHGTTVAEVDLHIPCLIPEDYLPDVHERLIMYKRIASATNSPDLKELQVEMIDRFGLLTQSIYNLFSVAKLKQLATSAGIEKIDIGDNGGRIIFSDSPNIDPANIIGLVQKMPARYKLDGNNKLRIIQDLSDPKMRIETITALIEGIVLPSSVATN